MYKGKQNTYAMSLHNTLIINYLFFLKEFEIFKKCIHLHRQVNTARHNNYLKQLLMNRLEQIHTNTGQHPRQELILQEMIQETFRYM